MPAPGFSIPNSDSATSHPTQEAQSLELGRVVIHAAADALLTLADSIDESFNVAITELENIKGRIIVTGMGKSGHIGRKFAATLSSTGKPAYFVHPGEASHGDLGMITSDDGVVALSNSGETAELQDILRFCRRNSLPLISVTQVKNSALARNSTVSLLIPDLPEACPNNLAPTTSTSLMLALCDALAVVLLQRRNFSSHDFHSFHPGGRLGKRLRSLAETMHSGAEMPLIAESATLPEAILEMTSKRFGCVGVFNTTTNALTGILTDGDIRRLLENNQESQFSDIRVDTVMSDHPVTLHGEEIVETALSRMQGNKITSIFVVDTNNLPLGIIHIHDLL